MVELWTIELRAFLLADSASELISSEYSVTEVHRNAARHGVAVARIEGLLDSLVLVPIDRSLLELAGRLPNIGMAGGGASFLRSADALHVATALRVPHTTFVTYDVRQGEAARTFGLTVASPS